MNSRAAVFPANPPTYGPSRYTLWIADEDENGIPVDSRFVAAAYDLAPKLFSYRQSEINCESATATLIQASVNAASRAAQSVAIENPFGYLLTVFTRKVDRFLSRSQIEVSVEDDFLEDAASRQERADAVATLLHNRILVERALSMMSPEVQELCDLHIIHGLPMDAIAEMKGEPRNRLAVRLSRGLKRIARALSSEHPHKRESKG
jgi:DNA-directed RNA polymerase specialized sigma24 family protein